ncbi:MAG: hypothetical protein A2W21_00555 [Betaproteobacteria bacterium RBG_16_66_20]|nr:MAG: hypothetical protein A2W21_00555 [Betaproteobacteria bacterium RBG_16_66_20]
MKLRGLYAITPDCADSALLIGRAGQALSGGIAALQYRNKLAGQEQRVLEATALATKCRERRVPFIVNDDVALALESGADGVHLGRDDGDLAAARAKLRGKLLGVSCYNSLAAARAAVAAGADYIAFGSVFPSPTKPAAVRVALALESGADGVHLGRDDGDLAAARAKLRGKLLGVSCYNSLAAARASVAAGADYIAFGSVFPSPTKPAAVRAPLALFGEARSLRVPLVAIGGITLDNAPQLLVAGADCLAVISDLFDAPDIAERARSYGKLWAHEIAQ